MSKVTQVTLSNGQVRVVAIVGNVCVGRAVPNVGGTYSVAGRGSLVGYANTAAEAAVTLSQLTA